MSKNSSIYIDRGKTTFYKVFGKHKQEYVLYCLYVITSFFGKLLLLGSPLFALADYRVVKNADENSNLDLGRAFEDAKTIKAIGTSFMVLTLRATALLAATILFGGITVLLGYIGIVLSEMAGIMHINIMYAFAVPGLLTLFYFIVLILLFFGPANYIIHCESNSNFSDIINTCHSIMTKNGKKALFFIGMHTIIHFVKYVILSFLILVIFNMFASREVLIICGVILCCVILFKIPKRIFIRKMAMLCLFQDLVNDTQYQGLGDKTSQESNNSLSKEDLLIALFNEPIQVRAEFENKANELNKEMTAIDTEDSSYEKSEAI